MRKLLNKELPWNTWGNFGINLALGNQLDQEINFEEYMYLPDYLYLSLKNAKKIEDGITKPLVKAEIIILDFNEKKTAISWINPLFVFSMLFFIFLHVSFIFLFLKTCFLIFILVYKITILAKDD